MKDEVVVVTGASAGLGRAIARHFGRKGARVGLLARGVDGLEGAKREIEAAGSFDADDMPIVEERDLGLGDHEDPVHVIAVG